MHVVFGTDEFHKNCKQMLSLQQQRELRRIFRSVGANPWIGDGLRTVWFREVRMRDKRLYYVIEASAVLFVAVSNKRTQQEVIDKHRLLLEEYRILLRELIRSGGRGLL